ncbi:MAG: YidC/Oxa1 family membrane protein insertase [Patescibacteria group bacterium]
MNIWNELLIRPILNLLIVLYKGFSAAAIPGAFGFAIVALTAIVRGALSPITNAQLASAKKMQLLKPKLDNLTKKHKEDKVALQKAQLSLYKEEGINPASGCLPLIVQIPVFIALYNVFSLILTNGATVEVVNKINAFVYHPLLQLSKLDLFFLGANLTTKPNEWQTQGVWLLSIPVITGVLQFIQTRLMTSEPHKSNTEPKKESPQPDDAMQMQKQMGMIMPVMVGFFALSFPLGLSLYWNTFTLFGIMQQLSINRKHSQHG